MKRSFDSFLSVSLNAINTVLKPRILWPSLLALVFIASGLASLSLPRRLAMVVWFPDARSGMKSKPKAELRYIPAYSEKERQAAALVEEMFLGPLNASSRPIAVTSTRLVSAIRSGKTLYIDVSSDMLFGKVSAKGVFDPPLLEPQEACQYLSRTLHKNFPFFTVILTIDGQEPSFKPSQGGESV
ncbi:MAG: GerMN domain-containing protein [Spirochaetia bacterium]|nr:GerMN domain-containing protein [Spirochaetia bacterium]